MEGRSTPDMISMSRPSRDNRASKTPKVTSDTANPPSKKSQIRASGASPRAAPASKKAKTGVETLAGASRASKKSEIGSGRSDESSSNHSLRGVSRSKRAAENGGDVTLDALRPVKKRKISKESGAPPSPLPSAGEAKSLKSQGENGNHVPAAPPTTTGEAPLPDSALRNPESGVGSADIISSGQVPEEIKGGSTPQIGSRVTRTANGLSGAEDERREELRALRPRPKPTAPKVKKRTRFHEITLGEEDGPRIVGRRIKVFWPLEQKFFYGHVKAYNGARKLQHKIVYDDKDEEWLRLQNEVFGIEMEPGEVFGGPAATSARETSTDAKHNDLDNNSNEHTGDAATAVDDGDTDIKAVETTDEGRIKPEGVYRRKRKDERTNEETTPRPDGASEHEKSEEGDRVAKKREERRKDKKKGKGDGEDKNTGKGAGEDKKTKGDSEPKKKTEGASERKKMLDGKESVRWKGESNSKQRGALADRLGRVNAKRSSGNSTVRERRKKGVLLLTSRDRRRKAISEGSSGRRKKVGKEKVRKDTSVTIRTRQSNLAEQEGKKILRSRIRDDDRLFPSVKSPSAVIRPKAPERKRSKEPKTPQSSSEVKYSGQTQIEEKVAVDDEKFTSSFAVNARERKQRQDNTSTGHGANVLGSFEAVMDAYREALSGTKDMPSYTANRGPEEPSAETVREDERAYVKTDSLDVQVDTEDVVGEDWHEPIRSTSGASPDPPVASRSESAVKAETLQFHKDRQQDGNETEMNLLAGGEFNEDGPRTGGEVSTTEVVLMPLIPPDTHLRPELKESPDKVYRRVKKCQPGKVYRRLKHSLNKVNNQGVDEPADVPQTVVPAPQYWFLARDLCSTPHVLDGGAVESTASAWSVEPVMPSSREYDRTSMEVGAYYGRPSLKSLLRVARDETYRLDLLLLSPTQSRAGADSVDLRSFLKAIAGMHSAVSSDDDGADSVSRGKLVSTDLREENGHDAVHESRLTTAHDISFMGPWFIDASTSNFEDLISPLTPPRYGEGIPRSLFIGKKSLPNTGSSSVLPRNTFYSLHKAILNGMDIARPADLETDGQQVGTHFGPPSVVSMLRVSEDFWLRLLAVQRKVQQPVNDVSTSTLNEKGSGTLQQPQGSIETVDDDDLSDQDYRAQDIAGAGSGLEPCAVGDDFGSSQPPSRSFGPMKKGRRTGKSLKRSLSETGGDSNGRDGLVVDRLVDGDVLSGRPHSKRTRVEIENSGAATIRDSGLETSPVVSDLDGKGFTATSLSTQDKKKDSTLPRVNVLKLRRCPTNKGVWLVAGNSCGAPPDAGSRVAGAETEPRVPDSRDLGAGVDPMTPIFETSRKRVLNQYQESPPVSRTNLSRNPAPASVSSADSQEPEISGSGLKPTKAFSLNASSPDPWFDCGIASVNSGVSDGLETRKRRRNGPSPNAVDDIDGISEHSLPRSADSSWGSCTANLLLNKGDRCIRETGAIVELQRRHGNNYILTVSLHGENQYAVKADQPIATGTSNKFTHSMMWRGGKAWSLEFVDRKQWQLFKDLHEECFQRNARAASVRHIPIPGVKPIQEFPKFGPRYVRPSLKYIRQYDGEAEVAFSSTRIVYDMDSEDEEWLNQLNTEKVSGRGTRSRAKVDEDTLERVIDKLEKTSFIQHQEAMPAEVAAELCQDLGPQDAIKVIHSYWSEKRRRKGMSLVRYFQPAPWEQYQKQLNEWHSKLDQLQQQSPTATKQQLQSQLKRPPLFAFCLRPKGLETRNKMQKQRSHRKHGFGSSSSRQWNLPGTPNDFFFDSPSKRQASADSTGGPFSGSRKFARQRGQDSSFPDPMAVDLTESFNAMAGKGFTLTGDAGQAISEGTPVFRRVESGSGQQFETSTTGGFSKRTKKLGRKAKKMKLIAAAEESRRKRQLRAQRGALNGRFTEMGQSPGSLSDLSPFPPITDPSTSRVSIPPPMVGRSDNDKVAFALAADAFAKAKREAATTLRSRAQTLHAIADAAMHKAVAAVVAADAIHAAERANEEAAERDKAEPVGNHRQQSDDVPASARDDVSRPWGRSEAAAAAGASFGSWRRALNSASKNANHILSKGSSSKAGLITDVDDALLPVASWSQELGAGLGTRLLQTGEASPQRQRYSPVLVEGISKSPGRGRGDGLVSLGRTRGESMMAMLTR